MKTKTLFLFCLTIGVGLTQLSAQNGKNGTGAVSYDWEFTAYSQAIICDGVEIDNLSGTVIAHEVDHAKDGEWVKSTWRYDGVVNSESGEKFTISAPAKADYIGMVNTWHFNFIGNNGSHYIGDITVNWAAEPWVVTIDKAICLDKIK